MIGYWICEDCKYMKVYPQTRFEPAEYVCQNKNCEFYTESAVDEDGNLLTECEGFKWAEREMD